MGQVAEGNNLLYFLVLMCSQDPLILLIATHILLLQKSLLWYAPGPGDLKQLSAKFGLAVSLGYR